MTKLEKVIKGIFEMLQRNTWKDIDDYRHRFQPVLNDALELLKAQQPRKAVYKTNPWTNLPVSFCPNCEEAIKMYEYGHGFAKRKYCSYCGQAIDWEDGEQE